VLLPVLSIRFLETTGYEIHALLECHTAYTGNSLPTFRGKLSVSSSRAKKSKEKILFNPFAPNDDYSGRTAPLTSKCCILYIYSTNADTEYFKHGMYCPFFPLQNAVCFINLTYLVPVLFTFYIQVC